MSQYERELRVLRELWSPRSRLALVGAYLAVVIAAFVYFDIPLTIEWAVLLLAGAAFISGRGLMFLRDWGAFVVVLFAWQITAPVATDLPFPWHATELIAADRAVFGVVPAQWLQHHLYHPGVLEPWDVFAAVMYMLHFVTPLMAGFFLWLANRELFHRYTVAFAVVAIGGYLTWIVYPSVPPWLAGQPLVHVGHTYIRPWIAARQGYPGGLQAAWAHAHVYLPHVKNLFSVFVWHWYNGYNGHLSLGILHGSVDQVGAIPSEHAAFPMLFFLFLRKQFGRPADILLVYVAGLVFSVMYLGQHYFIDVFVGFCYAGLGYAFALYALPVILRWFSGTRIHGVLQHVGRRVSGARKADLVKSSRS
jgi:membrane-associated phospholipid phosphatase